MKNFLFVICFLFSITASAQLTNNSGKISLKYSSGIIDTTSYSSYSMQLEVFVNKYIGINWNLDYLLRKDQVRQVHVPLGLIGGPLLMGMGFAKMADGDSTTKGGLVIVGILALVLPDGISFNIPIRNSWAVSPYANLLGIDFVKNQLTNEKNIKYAVSFGTKVTYMVRERFTVAGFVETRKTGSIPWGLGAGAGIGMLFGRGSNMMNKSDETEYVD